MKKVFDERGFETFDFAADHSSLPEAAGYVYVFCLSAGEGEIPFYVGESGRFRGRMGDYKSAQFKAPTDFRVGTATVRLRNAGLRVIVRYRVSADRFQEQQDLIWQCVIAGHRLLNCVPSYSYLKADRAAEEQKIVSFCELLLRTNKG
jgi:hypothetical protein